MAGNGPQRNVAPSLACGGNVLPVSFVKVSTAANATMLQCGANELPIGISPDGVQDPLGLAGASATYIGTTTLPCEIHAEGDVCLLRAGTGGWTRGDELVSDSSGYGVTAGNQYPNNVGAIALSSVAVNEYGLVQVRIRGYAAAGQKLNTVNTDLDDTATMTAAQILKGVIDAVPTSAATFTLPTAALLVAAIPGCRVGTTVDFIITNNSAGANTITVAASTGTVIAVDGTVTVAQNVCRMFRIVVTSVTALSEAATCYGIE